MGKRMTAMRIMVAVCVMALLAGCGSKAAEPVPTADAQTEPATTADTQAEPANDVVAITDSLGRELELQKNPQRVACMIGSFADVWCLAGGRDTVVAAANDSWTQFRLDFDESVANLGSISEPSVETLLSAQPDLVIASSKTKSNLELQTTLEKAGIPLVYFNISTLDDYLAMLDVCTQLTGAAENYKTYGEDVLARAQAALQRVPEGAEAPTVLYIRATGSSVKVKNSKDNVLGEMLADLGCENIADREAALLENLSMETIVMQDPDYIFVVFQGTDTTGAEENFQSAVLSNPAWNTLTAVNEGRYFVMSQRLYNVKPNALWGEAYEKLADILYPETK